MSNRLGIDVDGILADFSSAYAKALTAHTGIRFPKVSDSWPTEWYWERVGGVTPAQEREVWQQHILKNGSFWSGLGELPGAREAVRKLNHLTQTGTADVYFITHRMGLQAKHQTEVWLYGLGMNYPTVLMSGDKLPLIRSLGLNFFIDDKPETVLEVADWLRKDVGTGPSPMDSLLEFKLFLKDAPYNRQQTFPILVRRVPDVLTALKDAYGI